MKTLQEHWNNTLGTKTLRYRLKLARPGTLARNSSKNHLLRTRFLSRNFMELQRKATLRRKNRGFHRHHYTTYTTLCQSTSTLPTDAVKGFKISQCIDFHSDILRHFHHRHISKKDNTSSSDGVCCLVCVCVFSGKCCFPFAFFCMFLVTTTTLSCWNYCSKPRTGSDTKPHTCRCKTHTHKHIFVLQ